MLTPIRLSPFLLAYGLSASTASFLAPAQQHHVLKEGADNSKPMVTIPIDDTNRFIVHDDSKRKVNGQWIPISESAQGMHRSGVQVVTDAFGKRTGQESTNNYFNFAKSDLNNGEQKEMSNLKKKDHIQLGSQKGGWQGSRVLEGSEKPFWDKK